MSLIGYAENNYPTQKSEAVKHLFTSHGDFFRDAMQIEEHDEAGFRVFIVVIIVMMTRSETGW